MDIFCSGWMGGVVFIFVDVFVFVLVLTRGEINAWAILPAPMNAILSYTPPPPSPLVLEEKYWSG